MFSVHGFKTLHQSLAHFFEGKGHFDHCLFIKLGEFLKQ